MSLILASSSPFRKAILEKLRIDFKAAAPNINESRKNGESPFNLVNRLSKEKALEVAKSHSGLIIASDQVATLGNGNNEDDEIFTKPGSHENAFLQLKKSSGKTITFLTGLALLNTETLKIQTHVELFKVTFKQLSDNQILSYLNKEDVLNCAGSFKSEGLGIALFSSMEGNDPNSLIGLPTIQLIKMLAKENVHIL
ncbi:Maf family nucleotide pyrophosphatase [Candidatus Thioglobus sp.]|nr:nucleoside triphosphate pyrophosphatase [Candidatus Thioglobus sp.]MDA9060226.1 Maf family nucleotide pyrophosphatase [Candidatus Thioglobus sp.]MDB4038528.1 Maf family nucleotide pyrophosphatase [Candidatus Thioglobus sp.]MDC1220722.1 Maf family nucleotide pyrophosphatase [Candidatus Thioglobus sp.]MDC1417972.1 Maf family nucleotide pyrophosphatase [Candidatus Thioglobus sp.]